MEKSLLDDLLVKQINTDQRPTALHLYVDTSGSINKEAYRVPVLNAVSVARKHGLPLLVTFFNHQLGDHIQLDTDDSRAIEQIWEQFTQAAPQWGGTDFYVVWEDIITSAKNRDNLCVMITDFVWRLNGDKAAAAIHPPNLYYTPVISNNPSDTQWASEVLRMFIGDLRVGIAPDIQLRLLDVEQLLT